MLVLSVALRVGEQKGRCHPGQRPLISRTVFRALESQYDGASAILCFSAASSFSLRLQSGLVFLQLLHCFIIFSHDG